MRKTQNLVEHQWQFRILQCYQNWVDLRIGERVGSNLGGSTPDLLVKRVDWLDVLSKKNM